MWWLLAGALVFAIVLMVVLIRMSRVEVVTAQAPAPPASDLQPDVESLLRAGRTIEAIKRYRELHGVGLREAKDAVDATARALGTAVLPQHHRAAEPVLRVSDDAIEYEIRTGNLINAIRLYREKTGAGLREAKDAVEAWQHRISAS